MTLHDMERLGKGIHKSESFLVDFSREDPYGVLMADDPFDPVEEWNWFKEKPKGFPEDGWEVI